MVDGFDRTRRQNRGIDRWRSGNLGPWFHRGRFGLRLAFGAEVFDDPLVAGDLLRIDPLHQLLLGEDLRVGAGNPVAPDETFGRGDGVAFLGLLAAVVADGVAFLAAWFARAGEAKVFALHAPADDFDFLLFADEAADFLAGVVTAAKSAAKFAGSRRLLQQRMSAN